MPEEKIFTIPLRKAWRSPRTRRAKKAITLIKEFLARHMKSQDIRIGKSINESVWARGIQNPPRRVRIHALLENNVVYSELIGTELKPPTPEELKKKEEREKEKKKKIKEERKERKKMTIQEEIEEESGKKRVTPSKEAETKKKVEKIEKEKEVGEESVKFKKTGKA